MKRVNRFERAFPECRVTDRLRKPAQVLRFSAPVLTALQEPALEDSHWDRLKTLFKSEREPRDPAFRLGQLFGLPLKDCLEEVEEVAESARQEKSLWIQLEVLDAGWAETDIKIKNYRENSDIFVIC